MPRRGVQRPGAPVLLRHGVRPGASPGRSPWPCCATPPVSVRLPPLRPACQRCCRRHCGLVSVADPLHCQACGSRRAWPSLAPVSRPASPVVPHAAWRSGPASGLPVGVQSRPAVRVLARPGTRRSSAAYGGLQGSAARSLEQGTATPPRGRRIVVVLAMSWTEDARCARQCLYANVHCCARLHLRLRSIDLAQSRALFPCVVTTPT